jgi:hypothetical protein
MAWPGGISLMTAGDGQDGAPNLANTQCLTMENEVGTDKQA